MRKNWEEYFMDITKEVSNRSTCLRRKVGAITVRDKRILTTGYNGAPSGLQHCSEVGCLREKSNIPSGEKQELCRAVHAEQNAIIQASKFGVSLEGATIYVTNQPCVTCSKLIINSGIERVVYLNPYPDEMAMDILDESGVRVKSIGGIEYGR